MDCLYVFLFIYVFVNVLLLVITFILTLNRFLDYHLRQMMDNGSILKATNKYLKQKLTLISVKTLYLNSL